MVGTSGAAAERRAVVTARPRIWPCCISGTTGAMLLKNESTRPGIRSLIAGAAPR